MKLLKLTSIVIGSLLLCILIYFGVIVGNKLYKANEFKKSLNGTVLDQNFTFEDIQNGKKLQKGQIYSKTKIELSQIPSVWAKFTENDTLKENYKHLERLDFYAVVYKSDSQLVNGILTVPKKEGHYPVVIFNRGGNKEEGTMAKAKILFSLIV
ncbi:glycosyltransferase family protein [Flammeovirga aprica]|uniref:Uncharacterized protein n=1 Tax=Flammeovirga aprica JL-4 TaxID=694437 RepID=A0A7X9RUS8_9BACT|nr:hypothetical protein [Flammeovirga aprica]NME69098.1 hypothetical protein [Flammeovirga aprica JL-4]